MSVFIFSPAGVCEEPPAVLEPIIVTAVKTPAGFSRNLRSLEIIETDQIENAPVHSVPELLEYALGVDIRTRGVYGVQADVSVRGCYFEQVLILINGVRVNDPQTGHHNMDLPLTLRDIERIEILRGGGSSVYGANAFAGVINIITKRPESKKKVELEVLAGEYALLKKGLTIVYPLGIFNNRFSFERQASSGYRPQTDFETLTFYFDSLIEFEKGLFACSFGYIDKNFSAGNFYSNLTSQETEHTDTRLVSVKGELEVGILTVKPLVYYRRHWDKFKYKYGLSWYTNCHVTHSYGGEVRVNFDFSFVKAVLGGEISEQEVFSTNLGSHFRLSQALFLELEPKLSEKIILNFGLRGDHYQNWGWQASGAFDLGYLITPSFKLKSSVNRSFRIPTFTELYYQSAGNIGNENLIPEKSWSYEAGVDFVQDWLYSGISFFRREGGDIIDWIRTSQAVPWECKNLEDLNMNGVEIFTKMDLKKLNELCPVSRLSIGYTYLYSEKKRGDLISKYALDYLKNQFSSEIDFMLPLGMIQTVKLSYEERISQEGYFLLDSKISKKIERDGFSVEFFVETTNLLDVVYTEAGGIPMPGRWTQAGMGFEF